MLDVLASERFGGTPMGDHPAVMNQQNVRTDAPRQILIMQSGDDRLALFRELP